MPNGGTTTHQRSSSFLFSKNTDGREQSLALFCFFSSFSSVKKRLLFVEWDECDRSKYCVWDLNALIPHPPCTLHILAIESSSNPITHREWPGQAKTTTKETNERPNGAKRIAVCKANAFNTGQSRRTVLAGSLETINIHKQQQLKEWTHRIHRPVDHDWRATKTHGYHFLTDGVPHTWFFAVKPHRCYSISK